MNSKNVFRYIMEGFERENVSYVILHSYHNLSEGAFESDIDIAVNAVKIMDAVKLLDEILLGTGWRIIQFWRHEYYAADCVISNDYEFLQVDFCIHYERNGRILLPITELVDKRRKYEFFYIPAAETEFTYILIKKILKRKFTERSKIQLTALWFQMSEAERKTLQLNLHRFLSKSGIPPLLDLIEKEKYEDIDIMKLRADLMKSSSDFKANIHYFMFDILRKADRIIHPTGIFIVLLGVDGAGKTSIADKLTCCAR